MMQKQTVQVRNLILGEGRPKIAVPITAKNRQELESRLEQVKHSAADLVEYRADHDDLVMLGGGALMEALRLIRREIGDLPLLFTIRTMPEGGEAAIPFEQYRRLNIEAADSGLVDLVDVELLTAMDEASALIESLHAAGVRVIASSHDFEKTPPRRQLTAIVKAMQAVDADITKLAVMPRSRQDVLSFMETVLEIDEQIADRPCAAMSMGRLGMISRMAGSLDGSCITFGTAGAASAPGQPDAGLLRQILEIMD